MARIYSHDGYMAADARAIAASGETALEHAARIAREWDEPVQLEDGGAEVTVYPDDDEPDDWAVCDRCGQHAVHHSEGCR